MEQHRKSLLFFAKACHVAALKKSKEEDARLLPFYLLTGALLRLALAKPVASGCRSVQIGREGVERMESAGGGGYDQGPADGSGGGGGFPGGGFPGGFPFGGFGPEIFEELFSRDPFMSAFRAGGGGIPYTMQAPLRVTFLESVRGGKKSLRLTGAPGMSNAPLEVDIPPGAARGVLNCLFLSLLRTRLRLPSSDRSYLALLPLESRALLARAAPLLSPHAGRPRPPTSPLMRRRCHCTPAYCTRFWRPALGARPPAATGISNGEAIELQVPVTTQDRYGRSRPGAVRVVLQVEVAPDPVFRREGNDIHVTHEMKFTDAMLGARTTVPTIDGRAELLVPQCTQNGDKLRMRGKGVSSPRRPNVLGDQIVEIKVVAPRSLTDRQKELLREFEKEEAQKRGGGSSGGAGSGGSSWFR